MTPEVAEEGRGEPASGPYGCRWRTPPHGTLLELSARSLRAVERVLATAGVELEEPTLKRLAALWVLRSRAVAASLPFPRSSSAKTPTEMMCAVEGRRSTGPRVLRS
jgi:hypothetical protein